MPPSLPTGPTSEAELHLPLSTAWQVGEPPDTDTERHGAAGQQRSPAPRPAPAPQPAPPAVTQPRLNRPVRLSPPCPCS